MPTGGAKVVKRGFDDDGNPFEEDWAFHPAMWELKEIAEARAKYKNAKTAAGARGRQRVKTEHEEEVAAVSKQIAALISKQAGAPASERAAVQRDLEEAQGKLMALKSRNRVVKEEATNEGGAEGGGGSGGAARSSLGGGAAFVAALQPFFAQTVDIAKGISQNKETPEVEAARRAHELELARINADCEVRKAQALGQSIAQGIVAAMAAAKQM